MCTEADVGKEFEAAERSQTVSSANWKEDILLEKQLQVLDRSQRRLVHRITIEQKVLYRRFQMKLHRSKLTYARMWGSKDTERELRSKHMHGLNTNCGNNDEDIEFLKKLQHRPCVKTDMTKSRKPRLNNDLSDKDMDLLIHTVLKEQSTVSKNSGSMKTQMRERRRSDSAGFNPRKHFSTRPATATGTRVEEEYTVLPNIEGETVDDKMHTYMENISLNNSNNKTNNGKTMKVLNSYHDSSEDRPRVTFIQPRPQTASLIGFNPKKSHIERVKSAQASFKKGGKRVPLRRGSMFEEHAKPNIVEQYLNEVKYISYKDKIKEFCESLVPFQNKDLGSFADYYASKSQVSATRTITGAAITVPGTPSEELERHIGNTSVKSLTMPLVNFNIQSDFNGKVQNIEYSAVDSSFNTESDISEDSD